MKPQIHQTMIASPFAIAISVIVAFHEVHASPITSHKSVLQIETTNASRPIPKIRRTLLTGYELDVCTALVLLQTNHLLI
jgi:hypothetical protein